MDVVFVIASGTEREWLLCKARDAIITNRVPCSVHRLLKVFLFSIATFETECEELIITIIL